MKKKIGFKVSQNLGVNAHGAETHTVVEFMKYFSKHYEIELIGCEVYPEELAKYKKYTYINYENMPKIFRKLLHIPISIINTFIYAYNEKPDILFIPGGVFYNGLGILIAGKLLGIKTLVRTAEDHFNYYKFCENFKSKMKHYFVTKLFSRFVLKRADYVLTVGDASKEYFSSKVKGPEVFGIPGPISQVDFNLDTPKSELRQELGLPLDKNIILYAGAISGVKGSDELPKIIQAVLNKSDDFFFCIVGQETNGTKITQKIQEVSKDKCVMLAPMKHEQLRKYFNASDVLVFLTKIGVGYGQITIEATKAKLPVIAYNPGLDVEWYLKGHCYKDIDLISQKILDKDYSVVQMPKVFSSQYIEEEHLKLMKKLLEDK